MTIPAYQIIVKDLSGNAIGEIDRYKNLKFQKVLNAEGDFQFDMSIMDKKANSTYIAHRQREVYINRNSQVVFGGTMITDDGHISGKDDILTIHGFGFFELFKHRFTDPNSIVSFTATDAGQIAWSLINTSQGLPNGNAHITQGTIQTSVTRDRTYQIQQLYKAITDMAGNKVDRGFDLEITQTKVFNVYYPQKGSDKSGQISLAWGKNIDRIDFTHDHASPVNEAIVEGAGTGNGMPIAIVDDNNLQLSYGLLQDVIPSKDSIDIPTLQDYGGQEIVKRGRPRTQYTIYQIPGSDPDWTSVDTGDWVRVDIDKGFLSIHDIVRIVAMEITYNDGVEVVKYTFLYD